MRLEESMKHRPVHPVVRCWADYSLTVVGKYSVKYQSRCHCLSEWLRKKRSDFKLNLQNLIFPKYMLQI